MPARDQHDRLTAEGFVTPTEALPRWLATALDGRGRFSWSALVGAGLAELTVLVDRQPDGTIRAMAANETARRELEARADHVVAAWNTVARHLGAPPAQRLVCWVRPGLTVRAFEVRTKRPERRPAALSAESLAAAEADAAGVADRKVRKALVRLRARALERARLDRRETPQD